MNAISKIEAANPLDHRLALTQFNTPQAKAKLETTITLRGLAQKLGKVIKPAKAQLPWLKLATFGDVKSKAGSLRHDANVLSISGVEGDYDGEVMPMADAAAKLRDAGVAALFYTSPSHAPGKPRWRVLCPLSVEVTASERRALAGRLNGALGGILKGESFALSQSFYYGQVADGHPVEVELVKGGFLDLIEGVAPVYPGKADQPERPKDGSRSSVACSKAVSLILDGKSSEDLAEWASDNPWSDYLKDPERAIKRTWANAMPFAAAKALEDRRASQFPDLDAGDDSPAALKHGFRNYGRDLSGIPKPLYLVKTVLHAGQVAVMYGGSNSGKSFVSLDIAVHLAHGREWCGLRVRRADVTYLTFEGLGSFDGRIRAALKAKGLPDAIPFDVIAGASGILDNAHAQGYVIEQVRANGSGLLIVDTMSAALAGHDTSKVEVITAFLARISHRCEVHRD